MIKKKGNVKKKQYKDRVTFTADVPRNVPKLFSSL